MIFNLFISIVFAVIWNTMQVNTCCSGKVPCADSELVRAVNLITGFEYPQKNDFPKLKFSTVKKLLKIDSLPKESAINNNIDLLYCDLVCGNMHLLLSYFKTCEDRDSCHLSEKVTSHMLASLFKINKTIYVKPFWYVHMFLLYCSLCITNRIDRDPGMINSIKSILNNYITKWCRKDNRHDMIVNDNNNNNWRITLKNISDMITNTQNYNNFLLENETEKNWVSLKSMYLYKIKNENTLKYIIMNFGEQSEIVFNEIYNELDKSYNDALNYYYLVPWMTKLRMYQIKMLNVIRTVTLHLIRKHMVNANKYWQLNHKLFANINVSNTDVKNYLLDNKFFKMLFKFNYNKIKKVLKDSTRKLTVEKGVNLTLNKAIIDIEQIMKTLLPKFVPINYNEKLIDENIEQLSSEKKTHSKNDSNQITDIASKTLSENVENIKSYINYLDDLFYEYNIETIVSYIESYNIAENTDDYDYRNKILIQFDL